MINALMWSAEIPLIDWWTGMEYLGCTRECWQQSRSIFSGKHSGSMLHKIVYSGKTWWRSSHSLSYRRCAIHSWHSKLWGAHKIWRHWISRWHWLGLWDWRAGHRLLRAWEGSSGNDCTVFYCKRSRWTCYRPWCFCHFCIQSLVQLTSVRLSAWCLCSVHEEIEMAISCLCIDPSNAK